FTRSIHDALPISNDTPRIVKPLSLNLLKAFNTFGFSALHGPHQLAQKSSSTYLPRNEDSFTGTSAVSFWVKSMANIPTPVFFAMAIRPARSCPEYDCRIEAGNF